MGNLEVTPRGIDRRKMDQGQIRGAKAIQSGTVAVPDEKEECGTCKTGPMHLGDSCVNEPQRGRLPVGKETRQDNTMLVICLIS